jgi:hypothetical protein
MHRVNNIVYNTSMFTISVGAISGTVPLPSLEPNVADRIPVGERIGRVHDHCAMLRNPSLSCNRRHHGRLVPNDRLLMQPTRKCRADDGLMYEIIA